MTIIAEPPYWRDRFAAKRAANAEALPPSMILPSPPGADVLDVLDVPKTCGLMTDREVEITESKTVAILLERIAKREYTALEVAAAFIKRAVIAQQLVNAVTETFFDRALKQAQKLDDHMEATGKTVGPLHGLPISLKDQIEVKGTECTMSYVGWLGNIAEEDALMVTVLEEQGAIMYCRTNMAQGLSCLNSDNNVYGRTTNPHNRNLGPGGSSGGEGALIAMRGALLGVGSDLAGSIRVPAAHCGIYGLRGCRGRMPRSKSSDAVEGQSLVSSVLGPMSVSLDGLSTMYRAVLASKPWLRDPLCPRMPWSEAAYNLEDHGGDGDVPLQLGSANGTSKKGQAAVKGRVPKLCFGIMWDDGRVRALPPVSRALKTVRDALEAAGHEVIEWDAGDMKAMGRLLSGLASADGNADLRYQTSLSGEPVLAPWYDAKHPRPDIPASTLFGLNHERTQFITRQLDRWNATRSQTSTGRPIDAIICPVTPGPAFEHDAHQYAYTGWVNLADYASVAFPVTTVDERVDGKEAAMREMAAAVPLERSVMKKMRIDDARVEAWVEDDDRSSEGTSSDASEEEDGRWELCEEERKAWDAYDAHKTHGAPIGLQCVGRMYEEEAVLRMTEIIVHALDVAKADEWCLVSPVDNFQALATE